jgi:hypothetical protein
MMPAILFGSVFIGPAKRLGYQAIRFVRITSRGVYISKVYTNGTLSERGGVELLDHKAFDATQLNWGEQGPADPGSPLYKTALRQLCRTLADAALDSLS